MIMRMSLVCALLLASPGALASSETFSNFESGHVRPLALSPSGKHLLAVNSEDARLAILGVTDGGLRLVAEVPVGLEPVSVAARVTRQGRLEAWVVNHVSDSVSIVDVDEAVPSRSRVVRTLLVGDEPQDIVFAGPGHARAFITTARRGQNATVSPALTTPGVGRALVWVFDADGARGPGVDRPLTVLELFGDGPRALAVSGDGRTVHAAVFLSGNRTTSIAGPVMTRRAGGHPPREVDPTAPQTAQIVRFDPATRRWQDEEGTDLSRLVPFHLPDLDVFAIDATATPPALKKVGGAVSGVGTVLLGMAVRPGTEHVYVANLESLNHVISEPALRGHFTESRLTVIRNGQAVAHHLNPHIRYGARSSRKKRERSIGLPVSVAFSADGATAYVAAMGSGKIAALDASKLERGAVEPRLASVGGGPSGLAVDSGRKRVYVLNRFDHTVSWVDAVRMRELGAASLGYNPAPEVVRKGRPILYDTSLSAHGDQACASCHIFGDFDGLAWDLGEPGGPKPKNPNPYRLDGPLPRVFHPLKGPMVTQSLRGLAGAGPMHWRGDRTAAADRGGDAFDELGAFEKFNPAFKTLLGRPRLLPAGQMRAFAEFALTINYPPNPIRRLDGALTPQQVEGERIFLTRAPIDPSGGPCITCHVMPLGTDGMTSYDVQTQDFKVPHLRNLYQKVGKFGFPAGTFFPATEHLGNQVRGFGFLHDGSFDTIYTFLFSPILFFARPPDPKAEAERRAVEAYLFTFDTGLRPVVGQQVTLTAASRGERATLARLDLLVAQAGKGACDLVARRNQRGAARGWLLRRNRFLPSRTGAPAVTVAELTLLAAEPGGEVTFLCAPPGSGDRLALDRDRDGARDEDEQAAGSDPADAASKPPAPKPAPRAAAPPPATGPRPPQPNSATNTRRRVTP